MLKYFGLDFNTSYAQMMGSLFMKCLLTCLEGYHEPLKNSTNG